MKVITGRHIGAGHKVLRSFYVHAVRPIIDYASVALIASSTTLKEKLETIQNEAARIILGAPKWTKVINLLMETDLPSVDTRIDLMAAQFLSKVLQAPTNSYLRQSSQTPTTRLSVVCRQFLAHTYSQSFDTLSTKRFIACQGYGLPSP